MNVAGRYVANRPIAQSTFQRGDEVYIQRSDGSWTNAVVTGIEEQYSVTFFEGSLNHARPCFKTVNKNQIRSAAEHLSKICRQ